LQQFDGGWKSHKHHAQWRQSVRDYILPVFGGLDGNAIDTDLVLSVLRPL